MSNDKSSGSNADNTLHLLLVEDNNDDVQMFVDLISDHVSRPIDLSLASRLSEALDDLKGGKIDVVLLDLTLPDSDGADTYRAIKQVAPTIPIVILSGLDDEEVALRALGDGVQDYLVKGQVTGSLLMRSMRYAIERQHLIDRVHEADNKVAILASMLPICSSCKKVKTDDGSWLDMENYLRNFTQTKVQQTLCPACGRRFR